MLENWIGTEVKLIYDDNKTPTPKHGVLLGVDKEFVVLKTSRGQEAFRLDSVIRLERSGSNEKA